MKDKNWRGGKAKKEKKGNQQSRELAELVDSIGRSLLGLIFLSIFINGIKMQRNTFEKANNSEKLTEKNTKEKKRVVFPWGYCLDSTWNSTECSGHPTF